MTTPFGQHIRQARLARRATDPSFSLRQVATRVGIQPGYLSRIETGDSPPPSEATITALAHDLGEHADVALALAGKVSHDLRAIIVKRPQLFSELLRQLGDLPDHAVLRVVREVRDGEW